MNAFRSVLKRDMTLALRNKAELLNPLAFFTMMIVLFPLAITPENKLLHTIAPGIIWVAALLASFLSLPRLFQTDYLDGSLEQFLLAPQSLSSVVLAKVIAHWLLSILPLILLSPLLGVTLYLSGNEIEVLILSLLLGTPIFIFIGAIAAALTVNLRMNSALLALLIFPLYIPILVFGAGSVISVSVGMPVMGLLALLGAILSLAITFAPMASAAALRITIG